jgi:crotonobetainyl-CoA:carnitine CoA-transferase CaiB-like acyl-CoA transferase
MLPLDGIRVVELGQWVGAPAVGGVLADWGAEVIKIEPPGGDPMRNLNMTYSASTEKRVPAFDLDNRGKHSIIVDLSRAEGVEIARRLIATVDVFLTNVRMRSLERMGLDHHRLLPLHPRLVYMLITAYGTEGPARDDPGYDAGAFWARSGAASRFTPDGGVPPQIAGAFGDHVASMTAVSAVLAGLLARERHGVGQLVTTSLFRAGIYTVSGDLATRLALGRLGSVKSRENVRNPLFNCYRSRDGKWMWLIAAEPERHWTTIVKALDAPELLDDPRFADAIERRRHIAAIIPILDRIFATRDRDQWALRFADHGVWWAPVNTMEDLLDDPQAEAANAFTQMRSRTGEGTVRVPNGPIDFGAAEDRVLPAPPDPGQHTVALLESIGVDVAERERLLASSVVHAAADANVEMHR